MLCKAFCHSVIHLCYHCFTWAAVSAYLISVTDCLNHYHIMRMSKSSMPSILEWERKLNHLHIFVMILIYHISLLIHCIYYLSKQLSWWWDCQDIMTLIYVTSHYYDIVINQYDKASNKFCQKKRLSYLLFESIWWFLECIIINSRWKWKWDLEYHHNCDTLLF